LPAATPSRWSGGPEDHNPEDLRSSARLRYADASFPLAGSMSSELSIYPTDTHMHRGH